MFVSNLTNRSLGLSSPIVLRPNEVNRFIDDDNTKLVESVLRAKAANLVSVSDTKGVIKTIAATAVKTLTFDAGALGTEPRSSGKHTEEVKKVLKERLASTEETTEKVNLDKNVNEEKDSSKQKKSKKQSEKQDNKDI